MNEEEIKIIKSIVALNKIVDKLEQRISTLEKVIGKCGEWISKTGNKLFTYFDVDQSNNMGGDQYRMAKDNWEIK